MNEIVLASNNEHKIIEFRALLSGLNINVLSMREIGFSNEIIEDGESFYENAFIKARSIYDFSGKPVIADDSGLEINALTGAPGIYSARFAGKNASDLDNLSKVLNEMEGQENRKANFTAVLCLLNRNAEATFFEGQCYGNIAKKAKGINGFGYDPIFIPLGYEHSFSELGQTIKNEISHRAKATQLLMAHLKNTLNED